MFNFPAANLRQIAVGAVWAMDVAQWSGHRLAYLNNRSWAHNPLVTGLSYFSSSLIKMTDIIWSL